MGAQATSGVADLFGAIDLGTISASVITVGVAAIGITLAFKGVTLAKRALGKV